MAMKLKLRTVKINLLLITALFFLGAWEANAGTVILSTTTYETADEAGDAPVALPKAGAYYFDMVITSSGTAFTSVDVYLQQRGIASGQFYTIYNSTFTNCSIPCTRFIVPDMYLGGDVRARWSVGGGSATITVTARSVTP